MQTGHAGFDRFFSGPGAFVTGGTILAAWSPDGGALAFLEGAAEQRTGRLVDLATGEQRPLLADVGALREAIREATGQTPPGRGLPFEHLAFVGPRTVATAVGAVQVLIDVASGAVTKAPAENPIDVYQGYADSVRRTPQEFRRSLVLSDPVKSRELLSPDGNRFLSTEGGNLVLRSAVDNRRVQLTTDGTPEHEYRFDLVEPFLAMIGMAFPVCNWSPDGASSDWSSPSSPIQCAQ
ncbi:hypothetical protein [Amycolatopsis panacis]|uniref:Dipeptidylpeptidase IV N-terminal domain-containing protein n=1 Tax=Amycolatopsis panacis TaxID=2340917 RepID=A0A419I0G9_9PSEU|nr:hypothetical protein [Amycolatopsis panacis]RJQ83056.1 hypothetical protein D5S19_20490 [Amycolatopsis panacis]